MSGTKAGGLKAAATNKKLYGDGFYARIGKKGGTNGHTGGFAANPELARKAGAKGGKISRRGRSNKTQKLIDANYTKISLMVMDNYSVKDIAKETGIPMHSLYKFIREEIRG